MRLKPYILDPNNQSEIIIILYNIIKANKILTFDCILTVRNSRTFEVKLVEY